MTNHATAVEMEIRTRASIAASTERARAAHQQANDIAQEARNPLCWKWAANVHEAAILASQSPSADTAAKWADTAEAILAAMRPVWEAK